MRYESPFMTTWWALWAKRPRAQLAMTGSGNKGSQSLGGRLEVTTMDPRRWRSAITKSSAWSMVMGLRPKSSRINRSGARKRRISASQELSARAAWRVRPVPPGSRINHARTGLSGLPHVSRPRAGDAYERALAVVEPQVDEVVRALEQTLVRRRRLRPLAGYASGRKVDLRRLMAFEADPKHYDKLWMRWSVPHRREAAVLLLVDLSGSMRGSKAEAALAGTVLLAEALDRLGIRFAVYGFQDQVIRLCPFGEGLTPGARKAIGEIPLEIEGRRPGGHNCPAYNDDGPCLLESARDLLAQPVTDRVLIVISDGLPEGSRSSARDLHRAVETLGAQGEGIRLIGIGLGPDTEHVERFYPESVANVPVDAAAQRIGAVLMGVISPREPGP